MQPNVPPPTNQTVPLPTKFLTHHTHFAQLHALSPAFDPSNPIALFVKSKIGPSNLQPLPGYPTVCTQNDQLHPALWVQNNAAVHVQMPHGLTLLEQHHKTMQTRIHQTVYAPIFIPGNASHVSDMWPMYEFRKAHDAYVDGYFLKLPVCEKSLKLKTQIVIAQNNTKASPVHWIIPQQPLHTGIFVAHKGKFLLTAL